MMATIILFVILGLGTALMATATGQKQAAAGQQNSETSFSMAEAALNAQIYALSVKWPTATNAPSPSSSPDLGYPTSCNAASAGTSYCPSTADLGAFPSNTQTCPTGTPGDAWNPGTVRSSWTTYVRDAGTAGSSQQEVFNDATEESALPYNSSYAQPGNNYVWVRAVGTVNCKTSVLVAEVSMQTLALNFPQLVLNANSFDISNSGNKTIIDTNPNGGQTGQLSVRCNGTSYSTYPPPCATINKASQISPSSDTSSSTWVNPPAQSPTLTSTQLAAVKTLAQQNGTYFSGCPSSSASLAGSPVYIEGGSGCTVSISGDTNSLAAPGFLVLVNGSVSLGGNSTFYGVIYALNQGNLSTPVVTLGGDSTVDGGIDADGAASLSLGSSGNGTDCGSKKCGDLEFDAAAFNSIVGFGGADETPNTFRQLPANQ